MAIWLKKCSNLGQTANGYMVELQVITDEICQWLDKFEEEAVAYLSSSLTQTSRGLPPKTPARQKRFRKRLLKATNNEDAENSPPPCKSPRKPSNSTILSPESPMKKLSVCLTRIDENDSNNLMSQKKTRTPVKPPRRLKLAFESIQGTQSTELSQTDVTKSPTVALKERNTNTPSIKKTNTTPVSLSKVTQHSNRGSLLIPTLNLQRMSVSRRRSSISRVRARQSIRRSKRLSEKVQRAATIVDEINDNKDASFIAEEIVEPAEDRTAANAKDLLELVDAVTLVDDNLVQKTVVTKKQASPNHLGSNISAFIPVVKIIKHSSQDALNTTQTIVKHKVFDNFGDDSIDDGSPHNDIESDVDSVISKTPSPVCPANKVVRPKLARKPQSSVTRPLKTPVVKKSMSGGPDSRIKSLRSKPSISGYRTKAKARHSSLTSNNTYNMSRLSPKPMTPQQKQEKCVEMIYLREQKSKEILRQRNETIKKTIEERKRKRAEKVMKAKMQKEKIEEARLTKIREDEEKALQRKKMQEEAEKRRIAQEKQAKKEQELQRQMEQRQKEIEKKERLQREAEQKRIAKEKQENVQNVLSTTVTIDKSAINNTSVLDNICNESNNYNMTPQPIYPKPNHDADNYDIDHLNESDSTDDDEQPRQVIPRWAQGHEFKKAILQQQRTNINYEEIFPPEELMLVPNLTEIFHARKKKFEKRTSSAVWSSPVWKVV